MNKVCFVSPGSCLISLSQQGVDSFTVTYFKQIRTGMSYEEAAKELGECLMHRASCDGKLDDRERGER